MVLANLIREYPELAAKTKFIFVPGPNDPGLGNIFPRLGYISTHYRCGHAKNYISKSFQCNK